MSTPINDGGAAFPRPVIFFEEGGTHRGTLGMTLRDYFAGQALAGFQFQLPLERWWFVIDTNGNASDEYRYAIREEPHNLHDWEFEETGYGKGNDAEELAFSAYAVADAMLASRERKEDAP